MTTFHVCCRESAHAAARKQKLRTFALKMLRSKKDKLLKKYVRVNIEHPGYVQEFGQSGLVTSVSAEEKVSILTKESASIHVPLELVQLEQAELKATELKTFSRTSQSIKIAFLNCLGHSELDSDELEAVSAKKPAKLSNAHVEAWGTLLSWTFFEKISLKTHNCELCQILCQPGLGEEEREEIRQGLLRTGDC